MTEHHNKQFVNQGYRLAQHIKRLSYYPFYYLGQVSLLGNEWLQVYSADCDLPSALEADGGEIRSLLELLDAALAAGAVRVGVVLDADAHAGQQPQRVAVRRQGKVVGLLLTGVVG